MNISETRKGELAILANSLLGSLFPIVVVLSYSSLPPMVSLFGTTFFIALFFAVVLTAKKKWKEISLPGVWKDLLLVVIFICAGYYSFYFWGLKFTTPGNASIMGLMETFFSYLLFHVWKKEEFSKEHLLGAILMLIGAVIILLPKTSPLNMGDLLVVCATVLSPIGNYFQQKVRRRVSGETIMFWRSLAVLPLLWLLTIAFSEKIMFVQVMPALLWLAIIGIFLLGIKTLFWLEAILRISVTKANALCSFTPLFTLLMAYFILKQHPHVWQLISCVPMLLGLYLITRFNPTVETTPEAL